MNRKRSGEGGFTFVEVLAVILILGVLIAVALPNYFGAEADARTAVRSANVRAINSALALYQFRNSGACPTAGANFTAFLGNTAYFPDGAPVDPVGGGQTYFVAQYNATLCRVVP
jgi:prepilin-type N-terminal cleavage/methylation domain-containing protein